VTERVRSSSSMSVLFDGDVLAELGKELRMACGMGTVMGCRWCTT
jgi:hypothetical protein